MGKVLTGLEPKRVFEIFEDICAIPHGSGNEAEMAAYIEAFAKKNALKYIRDKFNNVIVYKPASKLAVTVSDDNKKANSKKQADKTLILQSHTDMVCEKLPSKQINFKKEPVKLNVDGDFVKADGTTLGADNGIGVAMILAVLEDKKAQHPNIEAVFTAEEETTMNGAKKLDTKQLVGKHLLSLDNSTEGKVVIGSAGFSHFKFTPLARKAAKKSKTDMPDIAENAEVYKLSLCGLIGGHSGNDIAKNRANANVELAKFILCHNFINLISFNGGDKLNAIPAYAAAQVCVEDKKVKKFKKLIAKHDKRLKKTYKHSDSNIALTAEPDVAQTMFSKTLAKSLLLLISELKNGPKSFYKDGIVKSSQNVALIKADNEQIEVAVSMRSSDDDEIEKFYREDELIAKRLGFKFEIVSRVPYFNMNVKCDLVQKCLISYKNILNIDAIAKRTHAGLEAGIFAGKIKGLEACIIGPNIFDLHCPSERVSVSSTGRVYKVLLDILKEFRS